MPRLKSYIRGVPIRSNQCFYNADIMYWCIYIFNWVMFVVYHGLPSTTWTRSYTFQWKLTKLKLFWPCQFHQDLCCSVRQNPDYVRVSLPHLLESALLLIRDCVGNHYEYWWQSDILWFSSWWWWWSWCWWWWGGLNKLMMNNRWLILACCELNIIRNVGIFLLSFALFLNH